MAGPLPLYTATAAIVASLAASPALGLLPIGPEQILNEFAFGAQSVVSADLDGDGDLDLAVANATGFSIEWYENDGADPPGFSASLVSTLPASPTVVVTGDLDGDGDVDLASASRFDSGVIWYENLGGSPLAWADHPITGFDFAGSYSVKIGDLDGDGDRDLALAARGIHTVAWIENEGGSPPEFTPHVLTFQAFHAVSVDIADLDADEDLDLVVAEVQGGRVTWWDNDGANPPVFTERVVAAEPAARVVTTGDFDGDGDRDVAAAVEHGGVAWYESDGAPTPSFTRHEIPTDPAFNVAIYSADADCDGDLDIYTSAVDTGRGVQYFENDGLDPPGFGDETLIPLDGASSVVAADLDSDGAFDLSATSIGLDRVSWFQGTGPALGCAQQCRNGIDDDGDGLVDFPLDPQCSGTGDAREGKNRKRCGAGVEIPFVLLAVRLARRRKRRADEERVSG